MPAVRGWSAMMAMSAHLLEPRTGSGVAEWNEITLRIGLGRSTTSTTRLVTCCVWHTWKAVGRRTPKSIIRISWNRHGPGLAWKCGQLAHDRLCIALPPS